MGDWDSMARELAAVRSRCGACNGNKFIAFNGGLACEVCGAIKGVYMGAKMSDGITEMAWTYGNPSYEQRTGRNEQPLFANSEYTGGSVGYYTVRVEKPTVLPEPYTVECNDVIEALGMTFAEGNAFKAIWRLCAARQGKAKEGYRDGLYDAEKVVFFGNRMVEQAKGK